MLIENLKLIDALITTCLWPVRGKDSIPTEGQGPGL